MTKPITEMTDDELEIEMAFCQRVIDNLPENDNDSFTFHSVHNFMSAIENEMRRRLDLPPQ